MKRTGEAMRYFPIFVDLKGRTVVVVGGGEEGLRKVRLLSRTEAQIFVIAASLHDELAANPRVQWFARRFEPSMVDGAALVISADAQLHDMVSEVARARGIPVNAVDRPDLSTFIVPSIVDRAPLVVAIGTEGTSPMLGQGLRARIDAMLPQTLGKLAAAAGALRGRVAKALPPGNRRRSFWTRFFFDDVGDAFLAGEMENYAALLEAQLHSRPVPIKGRVSFINSGNGDPELLTLKAQRKLLEADVIVHDRFIPAGILEVARRDAVRFPLGRIPFTDINAILVREAKAGRHVVRVRSGEALVEELAAVAAEGIPVETIPGISNEPTGHILTFPVREDIREAILKAAS
jgi:uroporphyrin-III C-methyltransferase / precorrin-2 dehydrogenase / sirohydrochlorin ferrochelatase